MGNPKIPQFPTHLPPDWRPRGRYLDDFMKVVGEERFEEALAGFAAYCNEHRLERVHWGSTFKWWCRKFMAPKAA